MQLLVQLSYYAFVGVMLLTVMCLPRSNGHVTHLGFLKRFTSALGREDRQHATKIVTKLRGGAADVEEVASSSSSSNNIVVDDGPCAILVSTSVGSMFLDKKKRLSVPRNSTVGELKGLIEKKFPGCPPIPLQRLFVGIRLLQDDEVIGNITTTSPTPILLDMMSGVSVYNKTLSISQALEAHVASIVQQSYLGTKLRETFTTSIATSTSNDTSSVMLPDSSYYRDMFDVVNRTLYETYGEDIAEALELEKEPETMADDTRAWRNPQQETKPLAAALAKEFDLNGKGIKSFVYYSVLLGIFALYGTTSPAAGQFLFFMVPVLWISKLRQLRLVFKILQYLVLPVIPSLEFLMPLLPAPMQVIAIETAQMTATGEHVPIVPKAKGKGRSSGIGKQKEAKKSMMDDQEEDMGSVLDGVFDDDADDVDRILKEEGYDDGEDEVGNEISTESSRRDEGSRKDSDVDDVAGTTYLLMIHHLIYQFAHILSYIPCETLSHSSSYTLPHTLPCAHFLINIHI